MKVLLVWQNDGLLAIYFDTPRGMRQAMALMRKVRKLNPSGDWKWLGHGNWFQQRGPIARLCVERDKVQP